MEQIKLYTEDQMKRCFNDAQMQWANYRFMYQDFEEYVIACGLQPIELPSDEEIEKYVLSHKYDDMFENLIEQGAKWVLEQIKKQTDGK